MTGGRKRRDARRDRAPCSSARAAQARRRAPRPGARRRRLAVRRQPRQPPRRSGTSAAPAGSTSAAVGLDRRAHLLVIRTARAAARPARLQAGHRQDPGRQPRPEHRRVEQPFDQIFNKWRTEVAGGGGPDMFIAPNDSLGKDAREGCSSTSTQLVSGKLPSARRSSRRRLEGRRQVLHGPRVPQGRRPVVRQEQGRDAADDDRRAPRRRQGRLDQARLRTRASTTSSAGRAPSAARSWTTPASAPPTRAASPTRSSTSRTSRTRARSSTPTATPLKTDFQTGKINAIIDGPWPTGRLPDRARRQPRRRADPGRPGRRRQPVHRHRRLVHQPQLDPEQRARGRRSRSRWSRPRRAGLRRRRRPRPGRPGGHDHRPDHPGLRGRGRRRPAPTPERAVQQLLGPVRRRAEQGHRHRCRSGHGRRRRLRRHERGERPRRPVRPDTDGAPRRGAPRLDIARSAPDPLDAGPARGRYSAPPAPEPVSPEESDSLMATTTADAAPTQPRVQRASGADRAVPLPGPGVHRDGHHHVLPAASSRSGCRSPTSG